MLQSGFGAVKETLNQSTWTLIAQKIKSRKKDTAEGEWSELNQVFTSYTQTQTDSLCVQYAYVVTNHTQSN